MIIYQTENVGKSYEYRSNSHTNWIVPPHIHEYSEIAFTKQGTTCVYLEGIKYLVPEKHLIFIRPNQIHEYSNETSSFMRCAVFSNDFVPLFTNSTLDKTLENPVIDFSDNFFLLKELEKTSSTDSVKICGLINLICSILLKKGVWISNRANPQAHNTLHQAIEYISAHFKEDVLLCDLAKKLGCHEKYLSSALHSLTGINFRKFLALYRIDYAKKLLKKPSSNLRIADIAMECGFSSINTFNRMFAVIVGLTPTEYKKRSNS